MRNLCAVIVLCCLGCGEPIAKVAERVNITGDVTMQGKPVSGVVLNLQPTGDGMPAVIDVVEGKFKAEVVPGKYTYFLTPGKDAAAFKSIPEKFHSASMDRQHDVTTGTTLNLVIE